MSRSWMTSCLLVAFSMALPTCGGQEEQEPNTDQRAWTGSCELASQGIVAARTSWQWQLTATLDTAVDAELYDVDLFEAPQSVIDELYAQERTVICYFSAGSYEEWRDDAADFPEQAIGNVLEGWEDERWVDIRSSGVRAVLEARLDLAASKQCDGVEPDNVDGYLNNPGFDFDGLDQLDFNAWLADAAHSRGLSVGRKNDVDQIEVLEPCFDWALNEECLSYDECGTYKPFVASGKAVFHVEYVDEDQT
jgi:hypothetical protein